MSFGCHQVHDACHRRDIPHPELLLHSPWVRTTQTADIVAAAYTHASMRTSSALQPGSNVAAVDATLAQLQASGVTVRHVVLVSHQPLVSQLVDHYLGERGRVPPLSPGGVVTLELEVPASACGRMLFWALPPEYEAGA